jgi:hypothetical protein
MATIRGKRRSATGIGRQKVRGVVLRWPPVAQVRFFQVMSCRVTPLSQWRDGSHVMRSISRAKDLVPIKTATHLPVVLLGLLGVGMLVKLGPQARRIESRH